MLQSRRTILSLTFLFLLASSALADAGKPNFTPAVYGDGRVWGTKSAAIISAPTDENALSYDKLFVFVNAPISQLPVSEAAPGNPSYNGGRWFVHSVVWTQAGLDAYPGGLPILTSYDDIQSHESLGHLLVMAGSPAGGPPPYFECPLLPVK